MAQHDRSHPDASVSATPPMAAHMTAEEFRSWGHQVIDWIADYHEQVAEYPVLSQVAPGDIRAALPDKPPAVGEDLAGVMADLDSIIMPGITHWQSPNFFAYFPANASGPSILGELLSAGLGVQGMLWSTSPACTELETHVLDWMVDLCGLPERFLSTGAGGGSIQDSASSAALSAMQAARHRCAVTDQSKLVAYTSTQAHSSIEKNARIIGLAPDQVRQIEVDKTFAMRVDLLAEAIEQDRAAGMVPFFVSATAGTTSSTAFDPVTDIAEVCGRLGVWLHVDGAFAGSAAVVPELRFVNAGLEAVDSYCFNPHKWLLTNFDCSLLFVADRSALIEALSILPEYLRNEATESGAVIDYRDWHVPLGRRFRSLKLWMVIRWYGAEGLQAFVRHHVALAAEFAQWLRDDPRFELTAPAPLSLVCFRHVDGDDRTRSLLEELNASGDFYLSHTVLDGKYSIRLAIGSVKTERAHIDAFRSALSTAAAN